MYRATTPWISPASLSLAKWRSTTATLPCFTTANICGARVCMCVCMHVCVS